ncbi:hypothetical protein HRbin15_02613 [bacterium HR15]|nr:hypothetical protein HRbin15_02613 [bacterium HR15]
MIEVKQGSAEELIAYLQHHRDKRNLMWLILDEESAEKVPEDSLQVGSRKQKRKTGRPRFVIEDGIPVLPKRGLKQPITTEFVKRLLEGDD